MTVQKSAGPAELEARRKVGLAGAALVRTGMVVGLGTGSTAAFAIEELGRRVREEKLAITGVPTSWSAAELAKRAGIDVRSVNDVAQLDLALDGADEVGPELVLIKGGGAAHTLEKIVATAAARFVVLVDETKLVRRLGDTFPVPAEVIEDALPLVRRRLEAMGAVVTQREGVTELGNRILDARFGPIEDPAALSMRLDAIPGLLEHGLFVGMAHLVLVGDLSSETVRRLTPAT